MEKKRSPSSLGRSLVQRFMLPAFALVFLLGTYGTYQMFHDEVDSIGQGLESIAATASLGIEGSTHMLIESDQSAGFMQIRKLLREVQAANNLPTEIYTVKLGGRGLEYVVMSQTTPFLGKLVAPNPTIEQVLADGIPRHVRTTRLDGREWLTGYAPIRSRDGKVVGVLGVDRFAGDLDIRHGQATAILAVLASIGLLGLLGIVRFLRHRVTKPLAQLAEAVRRVEQGRFDVKDLTEISTGDELQALARGVRAMAAEVADRESTTRQLRRIERSNRDLRETILSTISHELRTPVTSLVAYSEILSQGMSMSQEELVEFSGSIYRESRRLATLVDQVVAMAEFASAIQPSDIREIEIREVIDAAIAEQKDEAESCAVDTVVMGDFENTLRLADRPLQRAIQCVLSNAIQFSPHGGSVCIDVDLENPSELVIYVRDQGAGIPDDFAKVMFEPFNQGGDIMVDKPQGLGLGLSLAKMCLRSMGGDITLESTGPEGTSFRLVTPTVSRRSDSGVYEALVSRQEPSGVGVS